MHCAVGAGGATPQPANADPSGGHEVGSARRSRRHRQAEGEEAVADYVSCGTRVSKRDRRREISRVQCAHAERFTFYKLYCSTFNIYGIRP